MALSNLIQSRSMSVITSAKRALRKEIQASIGKLSKEEKQRQSTKVAEKVRVPSDLELVKSNVLCGQMENSCSQLLALAQFKESKRISVYLSTEDEINTLPILTHIFESGKEAFVPRYKGKNMQMVKLNSLEDYENLPLTKWNIKQPADKDVRDDALETGGLDLVILPGVAFTITGKRLGHGMGYYDKFLENCIASQGKKPHLIGIAFNEQIREDIPTNENDVPLDVIITEKYFE